jgi:hypothetical protein
MKTTCCLSFYDYLNILCGNFILCDNANAEKQGGVAHFRDNISEVTFQRLERKLVNSYLAGLWRSIFVFFLKGTKYPKYPLQGEGKNVFRICREGRNGFEMLLDGFFK